MTNFLLHYLSNPEQDVVFDVGANVGYYSVLTHRVCGDSVPVRAIEAEPENHRQLQHNLSQASAGSVVPHFCAVSEESGESKLYLWKASNRGKHSLVPFEGAETVTVKTRTLDDIYRDQGLDDHIALVCDQGFEMFEICDDQTVNPCTVDDLCDSRKGRNVAYVRKDLLQAQWLADALKMPSKPKR